MSPAPAARSAARDRAAGYYRRDRPEQTLLYRITEQHYPVFSTHPAEHDCMDAGGRATHGAVA